MAVFGVVLVVVALLVLVAVVVSLRRLRVEVVRVEARADDVAARMHALPPELVGSFGTGARHIVAVEILNLFELAHRESALTRPFTVLTPRLLRDVVHRRLVGKVRESLVANGVEADVRLHRAR